MPDAGTYAIFESVALFSLMSRSFVFRTNSMNGDSAAKLAFCARGKTDVPTLPAIGHTMTGCKRLPRNCAEENA
jgi:hypothetical protein